MDSWSLPASLSPAYGYCMSKGHLCQPRKILSRKSREMPSDSQGGVCKEHQCWDSVTAWPQAAVSPGLQGTL